MASLSDRLIERREKFADPKKPEQESKPTPATTTSATTTATGTSVYRDRIASRAAKYSDPEVDENYITQFLADAKAYNSSNAADRARMGFGTGLEVYDSRKQTGADLSHRSYEIRNYLNKNRDSLPEEYYNEFISYLDSFDSWNAGSLYDYYSSHNIYSQYDSEEEYAAARWNQQLTNKYQGKSYVELQEIMGELHPWDDHAELEWLKQYAPTVMTDTDYGVKIGEINTQIYPLERSLREMTARRDELQRLNTGYARSSTISQEQKDAVAEELEQLNAEIASVEAQLEALNASRWELTNQRKYNTLDDRPDFETGSAVAAEGATAGFGIGIGTNWFGKGDPVYDYINDLDGTRQEHLEYSARTNGESPYSIYDLMSNEEIANYNYLYNTEGKESAQEYLGYLEYALNERRMGTIQENAQAFANDAGVLASLASVSMNLMSGIGTLDVAGQNFVKGWKENITGEYAGPIDYNRAAMAPAVTSSAIRETRAQHYKDKYGEIALDPQEHPILSRVLNGKSMGDVYQLGMSMVDSAAVAVLSPVIGSYGTALLGGAASSQAILEAVENGATDEQALTMGILSGAFEMLFEKYELEHLLGADSNMLKALVNQALTEGIGEGATTIANSVADFMIMAENSGYQRLVAEYMKNGLSQNEAARQALLDYALQVGWDVVGGMLSGSMMGAATSPIQNVANRNAEAQRIYGSDPGALVTEALEIDPQNTFAQRMQGRLNDGKGLNGSQLNRLVQQNEKAIAKQDMQAIQDAAAQRLTELGETGNVESVAAALARQAAGEKLSKADRQAIAQSRYGQRVGNELNTENIRSGDYASAWAQNIGTERINANDYNQELMDLAVETAGATTSRTKPAAPGQEIKTSEGNLPGKDNKVSYEASEDGKTHLIYNPERDVSIKGIASVEKGSMKLTLEDGGIVDAADVSFGNEDEAVVYSAVAGMGVSVDTANALVNAFDPNKGVSAAMYAIDIREAYDFGRYNYPMKAAENDPYAAEKKQAWNDGRIAEIKSSRREDVNIKTAVREAKQTLQQTGKAVRGEHHAVLDEGIDYMDLSETQKASYQLADQVAQAAKVTVHVYAGKGVEQGYYRAKHDAVFLNLNAINKDGKSMMAFTLGHELVHRAKKGSPAKYQAFADFLMEQYGKQGSDIEQMIGEQLQAAKDSDIKMTRDRAFDEAVADACQRMLLDTDAGKKLAGFGAESQRNKSILGEIRRWIKEFMDKLRTMFQGVEPDSYAAREFAKFDKSVQQILADMYVDMTIDAGEHLTTIRAAFGKDTVVKANEAGEFTMAQSADGSEKIFNLVTWKNGGRQTLEATLLREGYTQEEVKAALTIMDGKQQLVENIASELNENGAMAFPEQGRINEATLTTDIKDGHSVLSALVSNGDYPVNIDLLMVCKKRKAYQRVINRLCETGMIQRATVDALAIAEINKILGKYGFETACLGCFVESRRLRIQEWAQTIVTEWNGEVKKRNPKAKPFGFGKGEAKLDADEIMQLIGELESGGEKNDKGNLNLGQGSAVKRMGVLLDKVPSLARTLSIEDLITPDGLSALRRFDSNLFSMVKSRYGSNSPKFVQEFNPYNHELAMYGKVPQQYESLREYLYAIGGARMQSFSDFIVENWFDYCQIVADLAARKLPMHTYTKEIALARLFGMTGIKINMSLIPDIDRSLGKEYAGLTRNAKGELELIWADKDRFKATGGKSYMQSINFADAIALQNDPRYSANVGTIAVGISDRHIRIMLADPRIRMVIPYHSSGMNPIFADLMGTSYYKDYTNFQNTTIKQVYNSKGQPVSLKLTKPQTAQLTGGFQFNEVLQDLGDARAAADAYKKWCADASLHTITIKGETYTAELTPKFNDFADETNYYKLLEDFNPYDCITEEAAPQGDVQQIYPEGFEDILRAELSGQERYRQKQEKNQAFDKAMGEIESYLETHSKADTVHYANQHGIKLGAKDKKLDAAGKARLKQLQQEGASFSLPKAEPAPTFYSHMARVVDGVKQEKLGASSVVSMLRGKGVKAEEIKWSGIETFLEGKKSVTKADLQEFIAGSMLQIEEDILTDKEIPYSQEHLDQIAKYEAERDTIAENLKSEWKRIVGTDIPITHFGAGLESAVVQNLLLANATKKGETEAGYKYNAAKAALQRCIEYSDHYFGYDNARQAFREAVRDPKDFMKSFEMTDFEKGVFRDFIKAKEAYSKVEGIPLEGQKALKAIAESADRFSNRIANVKSEHRAEAAKYLTKYRSYTIIGGSNYREILFRMPDATYSNSAMNVHWERSGVLAHARIQDLNTFLGKMLFIEEIQSDWHNEGHKSGYDNEADLARISKLEDQIAQILTEKDRLNQEYDAFLTRYWEEDLSNEEYEQYLGVRQEAMLDLSYRQKDAERELRELELKNTVPDAPFKETYHEYVLKRLLRMAAEQDYDSIGWTTAQIQSDRWSDEFAEGYRIEYDQDIPKFLNKYGKKWGTKVGKTVLDSGTEVWSMAITDEMKDSVLTEGQPLYKLPVRSNPYSYDALISKPDMVVTTVGGNVPKNRADVAHAAKQNAAKVGKFDPKTGSVSVHVEDINADVILSTKGLRHGLRRTNDPLNVPNYIVTVKAGEILKNSIRINEITPSDDNAKNSYVLMGAARDENGTYVVRFVVNHFDNNITAMDVLYAINAKKEPAATKSPRLTAEPLSVTSSTISIEELLDLVNQYFPDILPEEVLKHYGHDSRPEGDLGEDALYKLPVGEDTSPRALLANAFEGVAQGDIEKRNLKQYQENVDLLNAEEAKLQELKAEIKELSFAKGPRDKKRLSELRFEVMHTENRINTLDKMLLRFEGSAPLQNILQREKEMVRKRERERAKAQYKVSRSEIIETRDKRDATEKLRKLVLDTVKWISYPSKTDVKCPDILKKPYADFLNGIDMSSKRLAAGGDPTKNDLRLANAMGSLATALERIGMAQDPNSDSGTPLDSGYLDLPAGFVQKLRDMTESIKDMMEAGDYVVNSMSAEEVRQLSQMIRTLNHAIREMSTLYANLRFANVEALGDDSMGFMDDLGEIEKTSGMRDFVEWENALPYYAFKRFGDGGESIFEGLMNAQDKLAFLAQEIFGFRDKTWTDKEAKAWSEDTHTIDLPSGRSLTLTTADAMSIYCLSRRKQGLQHLLGGGVRVTGLQKGSRKAKDSRSILSIQDIDAINSSLSDRQRKVAEAMQEFMSTVCSEWGNEISMKRFLTREFTEKHYFPIESNDENLPTKDPSAQQSDLFRLLNISATKPIDPRANNEVIVRNIFDVFTGHASDMARLNAYGLPLLDYMKWLNYREKTANEEGQIQVRGVRKSMETAYGNAAKSYVLNLVKDVNGRPSDGGLPSFYTRMLKNAKTAMVGSSLRVATLQITSYPRAALVLNPRNLALGLTKKPNIKKAMKYCGIALWKSYGFYDTNISRSLEEQMKGATDVRQKMIEWSLKGAEIGDALTWGALWNACEYEVAATNKYQVGSEEFNKAVGNKLREVVYATQVVDSTLTRSEMMRSKNPKAQEVSAFMSEPTLSANILMDAGFRYNLEKRRSGNAKAAWKKTGGYVTKALAVYSIGQITAALMEALWDSWRDDEDEEFGEKYIDAFVENLVLDLLPFNKIPIISDMAEAVLSMFDLGFFSAESLYSTGLTQMVSAVGAWRDVLGGKSSATAYNALYKTVRALSSFYGVAFSGVMREGVAMWNNTAGAYDSTWKIRTYEPSKAEKAGLLLDALIEGDDRRAESLKAEFEDEKAIQSAMRSAIRERFLAGEIDTLGACRYLFLYGGMDAGDALWDVEEWAFEKENQGAEFGKYNEFYEAVRTGENLQAVIDKYTNNGVRMTDLRSQITSHFKDEYLDMSEADRGRIRGQIIDAYVACGVTREDAEYDLECWDFEAEYEFAYSDRKTAYINGEISAELLRRALMDFGGYSQEDADTQIQVYDWMAQGYDNATMSNVRKYNEFCRTAGVDIRTYLDIVEFANNTENDIDPETGNAISYSAVKKIMAEINRLNLSNEQKTAIALSLWKESTVNKYKLW